MSYSFGWWDFVDGAEPALVNRYTHERVVRLGVLSADFAPADESWVRFEYQANDLTFPLAVMWAPERGRIDIDYNRSMTMWRGERNADVVAPFGIFARVDSIVPDAMWCWPGVLDIYLQRSAALAGAHSCEDPGVQKIVAELPTVFRLGSWMNGEWRSSYVVEDVLSTTFSRAQIWPSLSFAKVSINDRYCDVDAIDKYGLGGCYDVTDRSEFYEAYSRISQRRWREISPNAMPMSWQFIGPDQLTKEYIRSAPKWISDRLVARRDHDVKGMSFEGHCFHSISDGGAVIVPVYFCDSHSHDPVRYWDFLMFSPAGAWGADTAVRVDNCSHEKHWGEHQYIMRYAGGPFKERTVDICHIDIRYVPRFSLKQESDPEPPLGLIENGACDYLLRSNYVSAFFGWPSCFFAEQSGSKDAPASRKADVIVVNDGYLGGKKRLGRGHICYHRRG